MTSQHVVYTWPKTFQQHFVQFTWQHAGPHSCSGVEKALKEFSILLRTHHQLPKRGGVKRQVREGNNFTAILYLGILKTAKKWETYNRLPSQTTLRQALSRYLDVTSVPSPQILKALSATVKSQRLNQLLWFTIPLQFILSLTDSSL